MIIIRKNQINDMVVTVSMNKTLPSPYYLFSFEHIASKDKVSFIGETIVSNTRYDKFRFNETTTTNLTLTPPNVNFNYLGQYYYSIYEQISSGNTNPSLSYNKLEEGRAVVIIGNAQTDDCWFEPYISNDENFSNIIYVSEQEEECQQPVLSPTPTSTPTPTPTPTCPVTTQYLEVELSESTKFKLILWNEPDFTSPATANCDYIISGTAYGSLGTIYTGQETITTGQHQHQFNLSPVLQPGEIVIGFDVISYTLSGCPCPVNLVLPTPVPVFNIGKGFNFTVNDINLQDNNKILVGGAFTIFNDETNIRLIRLNSDGSEDITFNIGSGFTGGNVINLITQPDGKILVGGSFTDFSGETNNKLIRLNSDGSKDTSFDIGSGFNVSGLFQVLDTELQPDGKIIAGGSFTTFTGETNNRLIRLNSDGSKDTTFDIGTGFNGSVFSVKLQPDGKILVGGGYNFFTGETNNRLIRLNNNGSKDTTFDIDSGFNNEVRTIELQPDGKILVGGQFTTFTGETNNHLIRLNSDGSKDTTFDIGSGFDLVIDSIELQPDGKILVGGGFSTFTGETNNGLIRLNSDGSKDTTFDTGTGFISSDIKTIQLLANNDILVGGAFTSYNGQNVDRLIKLNSTGQSITTTT